VILAEFVLWGEPLPKERPRFGNGKAYTTDKTAAAETAILDAFEFANPLWEPTIEDVSIQLTFFRKNHRTADLDNLLKTVMDALNRVAFVDDKQVVEIDARRIDGSGDRARTVFTMSEYLQ
jgi:crossover junction endodeoxyribonuclease RusA